MKLNYENLLETSIKATYWAGQEILRQYKTDYETIIKPDGSPVTSADLAAHNILMKYLEPTEIKVLSEEGEHFTHEFRQNNPYWCIDPIDGTHDFVNKTDEFCVSVGLIDENTSKIGILYAPALDLFYFAAEGMGSFKFIGDLNNFESSFEYLNFMEFLLDQSDALPSQASPKKPLFMASRYHRNPEIERYILDLRKKHPALEIVTMGSAIKLALMAERKAHEYLRYTHFNFWDVAGGHALCKYAGLKLYFPHSDVEINYEDENMRIKGYAMKW